jgi:hypothetical protein
VLVVVIANLQPARLVVADRLVDPVGALLQRFAAGKGVGPETGDDFGVAQRAGIVDDLLALLRIEQIGRSTCAPLIFNPRPSALRRNSDAVLP